MHSSVQLENRSAALKRIQREGRKAGRDGGGKQSWKITEMREEISERESRKMVLEEEKGNGGRDNSEREHKLAIICWCHRQKKCSKSYSSKRQCQS